MPRNLGSSSSLIVSRSETLPVRALPRFVVFSPNSLLSPLVMHTRYTSTVFPASGRAAPRRLRVLLGSSAAVKHPEAVTVYTFRRFPRTVFHFLPETRAPHGCIANCTARRAAGSPSIPVPGKHNGTPCLVKTLNCTRCSRLVRKAPQSSRGQLATGA